MLIYFRKIFHCKVSHKCYCQYFSSSSRKDFEHSYDQEANCQNGSFEKITITVAEFVLIQVFFFTVGCKTQKK